MGKSNDGQWTEKHPRPEPLQASTPLSTGGEGTEAANQTQHHTQLHAAVDAALQLNRKHPRRTQG